jgi:hypothetical protein
VHKQTQKKGHSEGKNKTTPTENKRTHVPKQRNRPRNFNLGRIVSSAGASELAVLNLPVLTPSVFPSSGF